MLEVNDQIKIPLKEIQFTFARGSGPGGQNVNKLNTKVTLRWRIDKSTNLPETVREKILLSHRRRINKDGELIIYSHRFRDQGRNVADCLNKLRDIIATAARPQKKRVATKMPRAAKLRRLSDKKMRSTQKQMRKPPKLDS